jgi:DNA-directed RNA polymerase beta' subunit
LGVP